jgi:formylglycine-generating enzyme required for sulfatase activity
LNGHQQQGIINLGIGASDVMVCCVKVIIMSTLRCWFCIGLCLLMGACASQPVKVEQQSSPTAVPQATVDRIQKNADWTPVEQEFDGVVMVKVPPGCFNMGNVDGRRDEKPVSLICFDKAFWIDKTEVTNAAYGSNGAFSGDLRPRENLTWVESRDFCVQRSARLPSEAEWEYATRGPDSLIYPWGNELVEDNLVFEKNSGNQTADVGSKPSGVSWVGALDMAGNVWEWTNSIYAPYPFDAKDGREDSANTTSQRVYRGGVGSYIDFAASSAARFRDKIDSRSWFVGFRCVRDEAAS